MTGRRPSITYSRESRSSRPTTPPRDPTPLSPSAQRYLVAPLGRRTKSRPFQGRTEQEDQAAVRGRQGSCEGGRTWAQGWTGFADGTPLSSLSSLSSGCRSSGGILRFALSDPQIVKHGGKEERNGIAVELDGLYKQMLESKYSKVRTGTRFYTSARSLKRRRSRLARATIVPDGQAHPSLVSPVNPSVHFATRQTNTIESVTRPPTT